MYNFENLSGCEKSNFWSKEMHQSDHLFILRANFYSNIFFQATAKRLDRKNSYSVLFTLFKEHHCRYKLWILRSLQSSTVCRKYFFQFVTKRDFKTSLKIQTIRCLCFSCWKHTKLHQTDAMRKLTQFYKIGQLSFELYLPLSRQEMKNK